MLGALEMDTTYRMAASPAYNANGQATVTVDKTLQLEETVLWPQERPARASPEAQVISTASSPSSTSASVRCASPNSPSRRVDVARRRGIIDASSLASLASAAAAASASVPEPRGRSSASRPLNESIGVHGDTSVGSRASLFSNGCGGSDSGDGLSGHGNDAATAAAAAAAYAAVAAAAAANAEAQMGLIDETRFLGAGGASTEAAKDGIVSPRASAQEDSSDLGPVPLPKDNRVSDMLMPSPRMLNLRAALASPKASFDGPSLMSPRVSPMPAWRPSCVDRIGYSPALVEEDEHVALSSTMSIPKVTRQFRSGCTATSAPLSSSVSISVGSVVSVEITEKLWAMEERWVRMKNEAAELRRILESRQSSG
eukprot:TRINITY_DN37387_c0_g1_i1.p1 TRINITY_DN37387_c0_g1~~TRINITY_DN37387_c0_g1_i1.p1  ORF type:complete len:370 (-),score=62.39 TRINITY_DN37387_c0_g1_i1:197-1306(-)